MQWHLLFGLATILTLATPEMGLTHPIEPSVTRSTAVAPTLEVADQQAIQEVIAAQIEAFERDDAEAAFALASPGIQARFGNANNFIAMVRSGYQSVYRPQAKRFLELVIAHGAPMQRVEILDQQGKLQVAVYAMEKQSDGEWRISGCWLMPSSATVANTI